MYFLDTCDWMLLICTAIHPSTKSPLAGTAWNFSLSQAWQLCSAGLSAANLRQAAGDFKGNAVKSCCWKWSDGCMLCVHTGNRYLLEVSDRGTNWESVHRSGGHNKYNLFASCHISILNTMHQYFQIQILREQLENKQSKHLFVIYFAEVWKISWVISI